MSNNNAWAEQVAQAVQSEGRTATGKRRELLTKVWQLTEKEVQQGFSGKGMTLKQLQNTYGAGAQMRCRVLRRHGVHQGQKPAKNEHGAPVIDAHGNPIMVDKIRLIDDSKRSGTNSRLMRLCETIAPCRFNYPAYVAQELYDQCQLLGIKKTPALVMSLDDTRAAYRQVPTSDPHMCVVCVYSYKKGETGARFYECRGHNFGHASSVCNYHIIGHPYCVAK